MQRTLWPMLVIVVVVIVLVIWRQKRYRRDTAGSLDAALSEAVQALKAGDRWKAEQIVHQASEETRQRYGAQSPVHAKALFNEATLLMGLGDMNRAVDVCRKACEVPAPDRPSQKDRLTYLMNLGELRTHAERLDEAETVLRDSLQERERFYGTEHAGYAYGITSLAGVLMTKGETEEALALVDRAIEIDLAARNPHVAEDVAIRAFIVKYQDASASSLDRWEELPPELRRNVVVHCTTHFGIQRPEVSLAVSRELRARLMESPSSRPGDLLEVTVAMSNCARMARNHAARIEALNASIDLVKNDPAHLVQAWLGLAMAHSDAAQSEQAEEAYKTAVALAESHHANRALAGALRNYAIWMAEQKQTTRAAETHRRAVATARNANDNEMLGRALAAYGIFLQHDEQTEDARPLLEESVKLLEPTHPDAFCAQNHLLAAREGKKCDCGEHSKEALAELLRRIILDRAPTGLVKEIHFNFEDEQSPISLEATRKPTDAEGEQLYRAVQSAIAELRARGKESGHADYKE